MPTWIYDWSFVVNEKSWIFELNWLRVPLYNASGSKEVIVSEAEESKLSLAGVCVDHVVAVRQRYAYGIGTLKGGNIVLSWYDMVKKFYTQELTIHDPDLTNPSHQRNQFRRALTADITHVGLKKQRASLDEDPDFEAWWSCAENRHFDLLREDEVTDRFDATLIIMAADRSFFITQSGYMGLGCPQERDEIWVLLGGDTPFILRPVPDSDECCLVGDCFLHGVMDGEAVVDLETRQRTVVL
ncbi:hypothetical protein BKA61DRAFT_565625 [Leptodontidium sp. MPI-SDFR-AT-0119]|nr:hypothetical protein BKA61DRAFT_565625 [Leptodontidium sp. MPI-SDFR-AT-0119]